MAVVKICGVRTVEHALVAASCGAAYVGLIFAPSRRQVTVEQAATIAAALRRAPARPRLVGVFVNEAPARMLAIAETCPLDAIQLSGDEDIALLEALRGCEVLKAIRLGTPEAAAWRDAPARLLVDAHVPGSYGGAGVVADWDAAAALAGERPIILAGGLTPENVAAAIRRVRPWGVDVSSGVETDGVKDSGKIRAFVAAAHTV